MPRAKKTDTDNTEVVEVTNEVNETTAPTLVQKSLWLPNDLDNMLI